MVQVIPKKTVKREPSWQKVLPWLSCFLVIVVVILYFVFSNQITRANASLEKLETDLAQAQTEEEQALERKIVTIKKRIDDVIVLLAEREKPSGVFEFLETYVHPNPHFTSLSLSLETRNINLEGTADDFKTLGQQIFALEKEPFILRETGSGTLKIMQKYFKEYAREKGHMPSKVIARFGSSTAIKEGIKSGLGISVLSLRAIDTEIRAGLLKALRFDEFKLFRHFYLIRDRRRTASPMCQAMLDFFHN